jgi:histidine phosphotransferase ChpT
MVVADDVVDFASMMCSRLCHDLLSPVGSFGNGLELLADEPDAQMRERFVDLLNSSSRSAINKLKFFRLSFGSAGGYGDAIPVQELKDAISGLFAEGRAFTLNWIGGEDGVPKPAARTLLLLAQTVVEALVRGGQIDMAVEQRDNALEIAVRGAGDRVVLDPATAAMFAHAGAELTPKTVGIALARRIAAARGGDIMLSRPADGELVVGAIIPV